MNPLDQWIIKIWPLNSTDIAAWVQAIGSIAAVIVTLIVVYVQFWHQRCIREKEHKLLVKRYLSTFIFLASGIAQKADLLKKWAESQNGNDLGFMRAEVEIIYKAMEDLPLWQIDTFDQIVTIISLKTHAKILFEILIQAEKQHFQSISWGQIVLSKLTTLIPDIKEKLPELIKLEHNY